VDVRRRLRRSVLRSLSLAAALALTAILLLPGSAGADPPKITQEKAIEIAKTDPNAIAPIPT
jgi:hypothetical protein